MFLKNCFHWKSLALANPNTLIFFVKVFTSVDMGTSVMTSLHILVFSALRFISLKWPHRFTKFTVQYATVSFKLFQVVQLSIIPGFWTFWDWCISICFTCVFVCSRYF